MGIPMRMELFLRVTLLLLAGGMIVDDASAADPWLVLPTENQALFEDAPDRFYRYVDRVVEGKAEQVVAGGCYGFTRTPVRIGDTVVYTQFHEGIDIQPVRYDKQRAPLDPVTAPADGRVVHVSTVSGNSNYGRYAVVEHMLQGAPYYTLYAHLAAITVSRGDAVSQGDVIGRIGYSGNGITKARSHVHYEFCLMMNRHASGWFRKHFPGQPDTHGIFNGMNLAGLDPAGLTLAVRADPATTVTDFIRRQTPLFRLVLNDMPRFDLVELYPWLAADADAPRPAAWAVTFSDQFVPMRAEGRPARVAAPTVEWLGPATPALLYQSRKLVSGTPEKPTLTRSGHRWADLLTPPE